ncbi:hypothetical protein CDAR_310231 [Caerostris darwini]|uniref:Uncharacterized protein n=1 Tax=Caerostris darwini TaxID=1538125 RepID=A0AAV4WQK3_9ARAC|nr:hypothetical protein CDAR_310231 [Caerostris darwini]
MTLPGRNPKKQLFTSSPSVPIHKFRNPPTSLREGVSRGPSARLHSGPTPIITNDFFFHQYKTKEEKKTPPLLNPLRIAPCSSLIPPIYDLAGAIPKKQLFTPSPGVPIHKFRNPLPLSERRGLAGTLSQTPFWPVCKLGQRPTREGPGPDRRERVEGSPGIHCLRAPGPKG